MAKLQCARLTKFIIPSVTDSPTDSRNNSIPKANPSKSTPPSAASIGLLLLPALPGRVFHHRDGVERHVHQLAADLLDAADVDVLHHVARLRVDHHRAARGLPLPPLGGGD